MMADFLLNLLTFLACDLLKVLPSHFQGQREDRLVPGYWRSASL
jgi:hypothetical protein